MFSSSSTSVASFSKSRHSEVEQKQAPVRFRSILQRQRVTYSSIAFKTCSINSSISKAFNGAKGRFMASNATTVSPLTRTTKFPRPGFSGFTVTVALLPMALTIALARVLNADHCLQASIITSAAPLVDPATGACSAAAFFAAPTRDLFSEDPKVFLVLVLAAATGIFLACDVDEARPEDLIVRRYGA